ncbi:MAG: hypothetical protein JO352_07040 [Chloroflexi bacterium]|nr:hypothetical protein [Chloroflexota bacterium]MBV9600312.1 hypothetical protein [Chloroflexota bacterium]
MQVVLVVAAIATGISAERRNRAEQNAPPVDAPRRRVPVESGSVARGASPFTTREQSRLLTLRRLIEQARALKNDLYDDLQADASTEGGSSSIWSTPWRSWRLFAVGIGIALVAVGGVGAWQVNAAMTRLERQSPEPISTGSMASHLLPGVIANPGRYLDAVNSGSSNLAGQRAPIEVSEWLDQKEAVDRFEAVVGLGIACLLAAIAGWPRPAAPPGYLEDDAAGSVGSDLLPFVLVASAFLAAISFFELV